MLETYYRRENCPTCKPVTDWLREAYKISDELTKAAKT
jgi:hypothetical protein